MQQRLALLTFTIQEVAIAVVYRSCAVRVSCLLPFVASVMATSTTSKEQTARAVKAPLCNDMKKMVLQAQKCNDDDVAVTDAWFVGLLLHNGGLHIPLAYRIFNPTCCTISTV